MVIREMVKSIGFWGAMGGILMVNFYKQREVFGYKFDPNYWEKFYNESQYRVPMSKREISDSGVYRYVGYRLVLGDNPFEIDYWVPPLGKYLYGLSAKFLGNPYITSVVMYLGGLIILGGLAKMTVGNGGAKLAMVLYGLNPLLLDQIGVTMLDSVLMVILLGHIWLIWGSEKGDWRKVAWAGITLGLMAGVKVAFFLPVIAIADVIYLWKKTGWRKLVVGAGGVAAGYVLAYFCYFVKHPNPIPWVRLHGKVIEYWKNGGRHLWGGWEIWRYLRSGKFLGLKGDQRIMMTGGWSPILGLGVAGAVWAGVKGGRLRYLAGLIIGWVVMIAMVDFWPRYLVPIVPVVILLLATAGQKDKKIGWGLVLISLLIYGMW